MEVSCFLINVFSKLYIAYWLLLYPKDCARSRGVDALCHTEAHLGVHSSIVQLSFWNSVCGRCFADYPSYFHVSFTLARLLRAHVLRFPVLLSNRNGSLESEWLQRTANVSASSVLRNSINIPGRYCQSHHQCICTDVPDQIPKNHLHFTSVCSLSHCVYQLISQRRHT